MVDTCIEAPEPEEIRLNALPEGDFIDGMLGLQVCLISDKII